MLILELPMEYSKLLKASGLMSFPAYQKNLCSFLWQYSTDVIYQIGKKKAFETPLFRRKFKKIKNLMEVCM